MPPSAPHRRRQLPLRAEVDAGGGQARAAAAAGARTGQSPSPPHRNPESKTQPACLGCQHTCPHGLPRTGCMMRIRRREHWLRHLRRCSCAAAQVLALWEVLWAEQYAQSLGSWSSSEAVRTLPRMLLSACACTSCRAIELGLSSMRGTAAGTEWRRARAGAARSGCPGGAQGWLAARPAGLLHCGCCTAPPAPAHGERRPGASIFCLIAAALACPLPGQLASHCDSHLGTDLAFAAAVHVCMHELCQCLVHCPR